MTVRFSMQAEKGELPTEIKKHQQENQEMQKVWHLQKPKDNHMLKRHKIRRRVNSTNI